MNSAALNKCEICDSTKEIRASGGNTSGSPRGLPLTEGSISKKVKRQTNTFAEELNEKLGGEVIYLTDDAESWVIIKKKFDMPPSREAFNSAWSSHPPSYHKLKVFGREVFENRWSQHWSSSHGEGYSYSGSRAIALCYKDKSIAGAEVVEELTSRCNDLVGRADRPCYNACLQNWYEPEHTIGLHADDEKQMDPSLPIFSLSWGGTRRFVLRPKDKDKHGGGGVRELFLDNGSLLVMGGTGASIGR
ncbi:hypothetical protein TrCOL_g5665 [Triparma columacea]|uniref:Alpha-ketoglutarate-dependent dioxygenase AlkB-like domain-containing protein n=1 Tax=Triparma columacea TaxID=722753 RepID=A0A9W7GKX0_9STRA|nr:hypothetical protein TrCOL_g5665 [Triparma columacea]